MKDGGAAFPVVYVSEKMGSNGMTLRDWFAGQAVVGLLAHRSEAVGSHTEMAAQAYYLADAMLAERGKQ
jgi:hypothetical protein